MTATSPFRSEERHLEPDDPRLEGGEEGVSWAPADVERSRVDRFLTETHMIQRGPRTSHRTRAYEAARHLESEWDTLRPWLEHPDDRVPLHLLNAVLGNEDSPLTGQPPLALRFLSTALTRAKQDGVILDPPLAQLLRSEPLEKFDLLANSELTRRLGTGEPRPWPQDGMGGMFETERLRIGGELAEGADHIRQWLLGGPDAQELDRAIELAAGTPVAGIIAAEAPSLTYEQRRRLREDVPHELATNDEAAREDLGTILLEQSEELVAAKDGLRSQGHPRGRRPASVLAAETMARRGERIESRSLKALGVSEEDHPSAPAFGKQVAAVLALPALSPADLETVLGWAIKASEASEIQEVIEGELHKQPGMDESLYRALLEQRDVEEGFRQSAARSLATWVHPGTGKELDKETVELARQHLTSVRFAVSFPDHIVDGDITRRHRLGGEQEMRSTLRTLEGLRNDHPPLDARVIDEILEVLEEHRPHTQSQAINGIHETLERVGLEGAIDTNRIAPMLDSSNDTVREAAFKILSHAHPHDRSQKAPSRRGPKLTS